MLCKVLPVDFNKSLCTIQIHKCFYTPNESYRFSEAVVQRCSVKKMFFKISQNSQENACARVFLLIKWQAQAFIKKETLAQVFSCEFCEILKNTFFIEHLWTTASDFRPAIARGNAADIANGCQMINQSHLEKYLEIEMNI